MYQLFDLEIWLYDKRLISMIIHLYKKGKR
jgi:hypothetical protein